MSKKQEPQDRDEKLAQPVREIVERDLKDSTLLPKGYWDLLEEIKRRISEARVRATLAVNRELVELYWNIGKLIIERQKHERWGSSVIERLSKDLRRSFPDVKGFSASNIWRMRAFYLAYAAQSENLAQSARETPAEDLPQAVAEIPWGHNTVLVEKVKDPVARLWYAQQTIEHGWSRNVLVHQIESDLYHRQGRALTNFPQTLPAPQSDLAHELVKDPYNFDFLGLTDDISERQLEESLTDHLTRFLLELGKGFAFVGRQHHMEVGGQDYYIDLLFYNYLLRAFVVIDLKAEPFRPEFAGKMNFYLAAVDDRLRHPDDQPPIGLILCKERNRVTVEYALRGIAQPMGVAQYHLLPEDVRDALPTPQQLQAELEKPGGKKAEE